MLSKRKEKVDGKNMEDSKIQYLDFFCCFYENVTALSDGKIKEIQKGCRNQ